ncbi:MULTISPECIES: beta-ketoacyl-[acyl-carrier-protein] synthase family protein [unclassified Curtobacterium]|uniref:beta-ketoacyl-[acyl-carrier-protein] synthase family protein n=1 Tax=unclassified Curtobacterium TaxID=257496 RepID=UPI000D8067A1|nr:MULTISPECIES: beta-ketoacyl-[acyl-carrier-protein] synthase family protein [unclassified Curtobacterium]PYY64714.1 beta-ketoacyl-ACP synthase [Curtobacterium sp. MCPF17_003]PZE68527.1 beta-ketoacyl-ACP synthase [Curtobacterium sp. MCPF17_018]PZF26273.1 beta-ketoacyl-ACP synthase [Curtobacterium sp. MCPF17_051]WIB72330.1 beta-ketoacyl-[acyl-carrier-protein] synthase family protein [Curtobacterium sp. MCBD17_026]
MDIVITGYGAVSPFGHGVAPLWDALVAGRSGVRALHRDGALWEQVPIRVGADAALDAEGSLGRVRANRLDRSQQLALVAADEAWSDAGAPAVEGDRLAVVIGTGIGGVETLLDAHDVLGASGARRVSPRTVPMLMANGAAAQISIAYGARGGAYTTVSACASGAEAIATAARLIATGEADVVITGGTEAAVTPVTMASFAQSQALAKPDGDDPTTLSRPFDADRRGFVLGEGAGIVVLERADHAAARGQRSHGTLAGWGITSDAHHITAPLTDGSEQERAMRAAIRMAGLTGGDVDHVNAHATGTPVGDVGEAAAVSRAVGTGALVTAPKSAIGHMFGAAGAVEAILTLRALETGTVPPTLNLDRLDPAVDLDVVSGTARTAPLRAALNNSFGFGGQNASLVFTAA